MPDKRTVSVGTHVCCKQHRWRLLEVLESCEELGLEAPIFETASLGGKKARIHAPVTALNADLLADQALDVLSTLLGSKSELWHGDLIVELSGITDGGRLAQGKQAVEKRGYHVEIRS
jgi:hypothetical protein